MKLSIVCETCDNIEVAACESDDPMELRLLLLAVHGGPPHNAPHRLKPLINGAQPQHGTHRYEIECMKLDCPNQRQYIFEKCSSVDASMFIVVAHGEHEGHPLSIKRDGEVIFASKMAV